MAKAQGEKQKKWTDETWPGETEFEIATAFEYDKKMFKEAKHYYEKACSQGHPLSQYNYGLWYLYGDRPGVRVNLTRARELFEASAEKGLGAAIMNVGDMYHKGIGGLPKDARKAFKLYRKALQDHRKNDCLTTIYTKLAQMCLEGRGTPKDIPKAIKWFERAQAAGADIPNQVVAMARMLEQIDPGMPRQKEMDNRWSRMGKALESLPEEKKPQTYGEWEDTLRRYGYELANKGTGALANTPCKFDKFMELSGGGQMQLMDSYEMQDAPLPSSTCGFCNMEEEELGAKMKKCVRCGQTYCSRGCQKKDWKEHKRICDAVVNRELPDDTQLGSGARAQ